MPAVNEVMSIRVSLAGLASVQAMIDAAGRAGSDRAMRRAMYKAAVPIRDAARAKVPDRYGALRESLIIQTGQEQMAVAGANGKTRLLRVGALKLYVTVRKDYFRLAPKLVSRRSVARGIRQGKWSLRARRLKSGENYLSYDEPRIYPRRYAHLVEFGTKPHAQGPVRMPDGSWVRWPGGVHPGSSPQPFMRPAFEEQSQRAEQLLVESIERELEVELAKIAGKAAGRRS